MSVGCSALFTQRLGRGRGAPKKNYIPDDVTFKTKPQIALDLIDRAKANGIRVLAWTADELYGHDGAFLDRLDERGEAFAVEIPPHAHVWLKKPKVLKKPQQNSTGRRKVYPRLRKCERQPSEVRHLASSIHPLFENKRRSGIASRTLIAAVRFGRSAGLSAGGRLTRAVLSAINAP
jgi:SRSO17 transposase